MESLEPFFCKRFPCAVTAVAPAELREPCLVAAVGCQIRVYEWRVNRSTLHCDLEQTGLVFARTFTTALQVFRNFIVYTDILAGANVLAVVVSSSPFFFSFFLEVCLFENGCEIVTKCSADGVREAATLRACRIPASQVVCRVGLFGSFGHSRKAEWVRKIK